MNIFYLQQNIVNFCRETSYYFRCNREWFGKLIVSRSIATLWRLGYLSWWASSSPRLTSRMHHKIRMFCLIRLLSDLLFYLCLTFKLCSEVVFYRLKQRSTFLSFLWYFYSGECLSRYWACLMILYIILLPS